MVFFNYSTKEITGKIVYYGPGLCGKTTNLQYIYRKLDPSTKGKMLSLATESDRTLFFDFLPVKLGTIRGMKVRFQLYTVPGQVFYNETRKLVLKGADAIVFVADSQKTMLEANEESYRNMEDNLRFNGLDPDTIPLLMQYNKRDLAEISSIEELNEALNVRDVQYLEAIAIQGKGVIETFQAIGKVLMNEIVKKHKIKGKKAPAAQPKEKTEPPPQKAEPVPEEVQHPSEVVLEIEEDPNPAASSPQKHTSMDEIDIIEPPKPAPTPVKPKKTVKVEAPPPPPDELLQALKEMKSALKQVRDELRDIRDTQTQIKKAMERNKVEIITSRPELIKSWFSKKIFKFE